MFHLKYAKLRILFIVVNSWKSQHKKASHQCWYDLYSKTIVVLLCFWGMSTRIKIYRLACAFQGMNICDIIWTITFWDNKSFVYRHYHGCIYRAKLLMQYYDDKMYGISGCWQNMLFKRVKAIISLSSFKAWIGLPSMVRFLSSIFAFPWKYSLKKYRIFDEIYWHTMIYTI